jgi:hypothetical protein
MLLPRQQVTWREWWYPVHGLGEGFEFATKDLAAQTIRNEGDLQLRLLATGRFPGVTCTVSRASCPRFEGGTPSTPQISGHMQLPCGNSGRDCAYDLIVVQ